MSPALKARIEEARKRYERLRKLGALPNPTKEWSQPSIESLTIALSGKTIKKP